MLENPNHTVPDAAPRRETGALLLAIGGLAAAFGVASCCAIPLLLASVGVGSAWLVAVASFAAPHRIALLTITTICLVGGGGLLLWRRRSAPVCTIDAQRRRFVTA